MSEFLSSRLLGQRDEKLYSRKC